MVDMPHCLERNILTYDVDPQQTNRTVLVYQSQVCEFNVGPEFLDDPV